MFMEMLFFFLIFWFQIAKVVDETLRWLTFSLMVFREAKADVIIGGQLYIYIYVVTYEG